jgi:hypothetical protein
MSILIFQILSVTFCFQNLHSRSPLRIINGLSFVFCSSFINCEDVFEAGAISGSSSHFTIFTSEFKSCSSIRSSGAISISANSVTFRDVFIWNCTSRQICHSAFVRGISDFGRISFNRTIVTDCTSHFQSYVNTLILSHSIQFLSSFNTTFNIVNNGCSGILSEKAETFCGTTINMVNVSGHYGIFFSSITDNFLMDHTNFIGNSATGNSLFRFVDVHPLFRNCVFGLNRFQELFESNQPIRIEQCQFDCEVISNESILTDQVIVVIEIQPLPQSWKLILNCFSASLLNFETDEELCFNMEFNRKINDIHRFPTNQKVFFRRASMDVIKRYFMTRRRAFDMDDRIVDDREDDTETIQEISILEKSEIQPDDLYDRRQEKAQLQRHLNGRGYIERSSDDPAQLPKTVKRPRVRIVFDHDGSDEFAKPRENNWLPQAERPLQLKS